MHSFLRSILKSFSDFFVRCGIQKAFGGNGILAPFPVPVTNGVMASATLVALCISAYGCMLRSYLPHEFLWNRDTWGYLQPALSWINGQGFIQTDGRNGLYPSLLILFLSFGKGFSGIVLAQQAIGVLAGLLLWGVWLLWWKCLPPSRLRDIVAPIPGLAALALYVWNPATAVFELSLRPDGVLPCFGFLQLGCAIVFVMGVCYPGHRRGWTVLSGALSLVLAYCCFQLKPSWAFAMVFTSLPVVAALIFTPGRRSDVLLALVAGGLLVGGLSVAYKVWMHQDFASASFLPTTLVTIHADLIAEQLHKSDFSSADGPAKKAFADHLEKELGLARELPDYKKLGKKLGFDHDYLMYQSALAGPLLKGGMSKEQVARYYYQLYFSAWRGSPLRMLRKILLQMSYFGLPDTKTFLIKDVDISQEYSDSLVVSGSIKMPGPSSGNSILAADRYPGASLSASPLPGLHAPPWLGEVASAFVWSCPVLMGLFAIAFTLQCRRRSSMVLPGLIACLLFSAPFGNAIAVSTVHVLDMNRYRQTYGPFLALALAAFAVYILISLVGFFLSAKCLQVAGSAAGTGELPRMPLR